MTTITQTRRCRGCGVDEPSGYCTRCRREYGRAMRAAEAARMQSLRRSERDARWNAQHGLPHGTGWEAIAEGFCDCPFCAERVHEGHGGYLWHPRMAREALADILATVADSYAEVAV